MIDNSRVVLENGIEYDVVEKIELNQQAYIYLVNPKEMEDICIRKEIEENGKTYLVGLDNQEEVNLALKLFAEKNQTEEN